MKVTFLLVAVATLAGVVGFTASASRQDRTTLVPAIYGQGLKKVRRDRWLGLRAIR